MALLGGAVLTMAVALPVLATSQAGPLAVSVTTSPNPYALEGTTSVTKSVGVLGYGTGTSDVALEGYATQAGSTGLEGFAQATTGAISDGVFGYSGNGVGVYGTSATSAYPGVYGIDTQSGGVGVFGKGAGDGVFGQSTASNGVVGVTQSATAAPYVYAGVLGEDTTAAGQIGVEGTSASGFGVFGTSTNGDGIEGQTSGVNGFFAGVTGIDPVTTNTGSFFNDGVFGQSADGDGVQGEGQSTFSYGVEGDTYGDAGIGVIAYSDNADATSLEVYDDAGEPIKVIGPGPSPSPSASPIEIMSVDGSGNLTVTGTVTASGSPAETVRDKSGASRVMYGTRSTESTVEDFGEGHMTAGQAYVPLEPTFANVLDGKSSYLVFITPEGPNSGYYVTGKSLRGFTVRDMTGRTVMDFDYRIVGRPADESTRPRLALARPALSARFLRAGRHPGSRARIAALAAKRHAPQPLDRGPHAAAMPFVFQPKALSR